MSTACGKMIVYLIQHSHADIGYTASQTEIANDHVSYIRDVVEYNATHELKCKWVCEELWGVEQFMNSASPLEIEKLVKCIKEKTIGLSGSYLNMTEAIADEVIEDVLLSAHQRIHELGIEATCAMTADVNGYSAGFPRIMNRVGVKYLLSLINDTHGGVPLRRQTPFIWKGPDDSKLVCWIGEHYHQGNLSGLNIPLGMTVQEALAIAEEKLPLYIQSLRDAQYPYDFCPLTVSGVWIDNSPPSFEIAQLVALWNQKHADQIEIRYCLLEDFFEKVAQIEDTLPIYSGDWTDWWADGIASTADALRIFRQAQRNYLLVKKMDPQCKSISLQIQKQAAYFLTLFAEHTWGHSASVSDPWDYSVARLELQKCAYATMADSLVQQNYMKVMSKHGWTPKKAGLYHTFRVINPHDRQIEDAVRFEIPFSMEYVPPTEISTEGKTYPVQYSEGKLWSTVKLEKNSALTFQSESDSILTSDISFDGKWLLTPFYKIQVDQEAGGIVSILDRISTKELISENSAAFRPIYEVTPIEENDPCLSRANMGQSRSCSSTKRSYGKLLSATLSENGSVFAKLVLEYDLEGCRMARVEYKLYQHIPTIDISFILHKDSCREPENLYLTMPFSSPSRNAWIDKGSTPIRPGTDGLPGACASFYSLQNGIVWCENDFGIGIASLDSPLIRRGAIEETDALLCKGDERDNHAPISSWVLNNFWETNFKATVGGFHEFRFRFSAGTAFSDPAQGLERIALLAIGMPTVTLVQQNSK